jgi:putative hydrolase of the HAD superfamily
MRLDAVSLDAGGVLVHPNWTRVSRALARHGVDVAPTALARADLLAKRALDEPAHIGSTTDAARVGPYFDLVLRHAGVTPAAATRAALLEVDAYHARHNLWECVPAEVPGVLHRLRRGGLRLVVISNANGTLAALLDRVGLAAHFEVLLDSTVEGVEKPDPRIFRRALARLGARAERTLHVGDLYHVDVAGARAAGLHAVLLDVAGLYVDHDCPRVDSLTALAELLGPAT